MPHTPTRAVGRARVALQSSVGGIRVGIVGVGNCACSLLQGVNFYRNADPCTAVPGLMHVKLGGYHVGDVKFSAAFDVNATKVGKDLGEAAFAVAWAEGRALTLERALELALAEKEAVAGPPVNTRAA